MSRYGLYGAHSRDFLSYGGRVLTHTSREELQFLFPNADIRPVPASFGPEFCMSIKDHPGLEHFTWPLNRKDFR